MSRSKPLPLHSLALPVIALAGALLACTRAEIPITPMTPQYATPLEPQDTPTPKPTPTPEGTATPTLTPTIDPTLFTPTPTSTPPPQTFPQPLPPNPSITDRFTALTSDGLEVPNSNVVKDLNTASATLVTGEHPDWILDMRAPQPIMGVRFYPMLDDNGEAPGLLGIDVSLDGQNWSNVLFAKGDCGVTPNCFVLPTDQWVETSFAGQTLQFIRLRAAPGALRIAEIEVVVGQ